MIYCLLVMYDTKHKHFKRTREILRDMCATNIFGEISNNELSKAGQLIRTIKRFIIFGTTIGFLIVLLTCIVYISLEHSASFEDYESYTYQYTSSISGLYLKSPTPALICVLYVLFFAMLVGYYKFLLKNGMFSGILISLGKK